MVKFSLFLFLFKLLAVYLSPWSSCLGQCFSKFNVHMGHLGILLTRFRFSRFHMGPGSLHFLASLSVILMLLGHDPTLKSKGLDHLLYTSSRKVLFYWQIFMVHFVAYLFKFSWGLVHHQFFWNLIKHF